MLVYGSVIQCIFFGGGPTKNTATWLELAEPTLQMTPPAQGLARKVMIQPKSNSTKAFDQR